MKTKEIQLGDYVKCSDKGIPMVVVGIYGDVAYLDFEGNESDMWEVDEEDLVPIPITDEIVKKNGFWEEDGSYVSGENLSNHIKIYKCTEGRWWIEMSIGRISTNIKYVHELQHILMFFNIDKEIEL